MLVMSRKTDEEIVIGDGVNEVSVMVVEIRGDKVRLGIAAPRTVVIDRREVRDRKLAAAAAMTEIEPPGLA